MYAANIWDADRVGGSIIFISLSLGDGGDAQSLENLRLTAESPHHAADFRRWHHLLKPVTPPKLTRPTWRSSGPSCHVSGVDTGDSSAGHDRDGDYVSVRPRRHNSSPETSAAAEQKPETTMYLYLQSR